MNNLDLGRLIPVLLGVVLLLAGVLFLLLRVL
jgi:hypothetical protein